MDFRDLPPEAISGDRFATLGVHWENSTCSHDSTLDMTFDEFGNLLSVTLPDATVVEYEIDARNRRVGRQVDPQVETGSRHDASRRESRSDDDETGRGSEGDEVAAADLLAELDEDANLEAVDTRASKVQDSINRGR